METTDNSSSSAIERKLLKSPKTTPWAHYVITKLIEFQARTKTIKSIIQNYDIRITNEDIGRLYKDTHGKASARGLETYNPERLINTTDRTLHVSVYYALYKEYSRLYPDKPIALIESYIEYLRIFDTDSENAPLSFSNAYNAVVFVSSNAYVFTRCFHCKLHFVHLINTPLSNSSCPSCVIMKRNAKSKLSLVQSNTDSTKDATYS